MPNDQYSNEASTSRCKKQLVQPTSTSSSDNWRGEAEIKRLEGRLKILEEEAEILKGALLESAEESRTLIGDIHLQLYTVQRHLLQRGAERGESRSHGIPRVKERERRAGLLQILYQEANPSIVNKVSRTKVLLQDST
ncbi:uncharacterized protein LOC125204499 [Salvia hispanica]|uniref:uncharacterized protein LOC125204499 n=1 Tax=Salvia hispanica TaxID=49212 RepID=UPI002009477F|nr:uncharacterized protein LOC125204499 [Salvia hispanica]